MASTYPQSLDTLPTNHRNDVNEEVNADDVNDLADAINKVQRAHGRVYGIEAFGPVVNNSPANASVVRAAIQAAIDAAYAAGGGEVVLPAGFWYIDAPIVMKNFVTLRGVGQPHRSPEYGIAVSTQSCLVLSGTKDYSMIVNSDIVNGNTSLCIRDLQLILNVGGITGDPIGIDWQTVRRSLIDNVYVQQGASTNRTSLYLGRDSKGCEMIRVYRSFFEGGGIRSLWSNAVNIIDCEVGSAGIDMQQGFYCQVIGCQIYNDGLSVGVDFPQWRVGLTLTYMRDTLVKSNSILAFSHDGLQLLSTQNCIIQGNVFNDNARLDSTRAGILLDCVDSSGSWNAINNLIANNRCYNRMVSASQQYGIRISQSQGLTKDNKILDNDFRGNGTKEVSTGGNKNNVILNRNPPRTYTGGGGAMTIDLNAQDIFICTINNTAAVSFPNPTDQTVGKELTIDLKNTSGGVMGAVTFGSDFLLGGAWVNPANGKRRWIKFYYDGTNWVEIGRATVDI